jgi:hypothetical protein
MGFFNKKKDINQLEEERQRTQVQREITQDQLDIEQKRALIAEAKRRYGSNWTKVFSNAGGGINWSELKFRTGNEGRSHSVSGR